MAEGDPVCRPLMRIPGVEEVLALTYRSAVNYPSRFTSSKNVEPWVSLKFSHKQLVERDNSGAFTASVQSDVALPPLFTAALQKKPRNFDWPSQVGPPTRQEET